MLHAPHPLRIQRKRTKGWKMPHGAVYVGRPTIFGNPCAPGDFFCPFHWEKGLGMLACEIVGVDMLKRLNEDQCYRLFKLLVILSPKWHQKIKEHLPGKLLACWCPLDKPCHADVLASIANGF